MSTMLASEPFSYDLFHDFHGRDSISLEMCETVAFIVVGFLFFWEFDCCFTWQLRACDECGLWGLLSSN